MTSEVMQAALEPCPFCGSDQVATSDGFADFEDEPDWGAFCKMCEATVCRNTEAEAIAAWNTRPTAQSGEQQSCEPIATVEMIETVTGDFHTEPGEPIWRVMVGEYCADFDFEQAARNFASAINMASQSGEGRSGAGEEPGPFHVSQSGDGKKLWFSARDPASGVTIPARDRTDARNLVSSLNHACATFAALNARQSGEDKAIMRELRPSKAAMEKIERMEQANAAGLAEIRNMPFGGAAQSGEGEREKFLTAYVSEDCKIIGIEHDTDADWHKVHDAHIALWNRLEERIREREKCPRKPALRATDDAGGAAKAPDTGEGE